MANTVLLKGRGVRKEAVAAGTITPGDLLNINSSGLLIRHASAARRAPALFAVENDLVGKTIDDNYVANDYVQAEYLRTGDEVYALVAASASAIVIGDYLESDGAGGLRKITDFTDAELDTIGGGAIAMALQAVDNSGNASSRARIKVVIIS